MRLRDKVVVVTGGVSGIGAAVVERFVDEGAEVVAADIALGGRWRVDVSQEASCAELVQAVLAEHGRIDCLVNSAGIGGDTPFLETTLAAFDRILAVNLRGTFLIGQACARAMRAGGSIVNIGSVSGLRGNVGRAAYGASKGGVVTLSQVMATELAALGIRVNVIAPGPVDTPLAAELHDDATKRAWTGAVPLGRYGTAEEIAAAALYLCSDEAGYVTGHVLAVDGGFLAGGLRR